MVACAQFSALLVALAVLWWFYVRPAAPCLSPRVAWQSGGTAGVIVVRVTRDGVPVVGYPVESESLSGTEGEAFTDACGTAVLRQGESEVVALHLARRPIHLRPAPGSELFALPSVARGLTFYVAL